MTSANEQELNTRMNAWLNRLATRGLNRSHPMPALGSLFSFLTSGFAPRDGDLITPGASDDHGAYDMTVVTRAHYNETARYPRLRPSLEAIFEDFPGLRQQFNAQMEAYPTRDSVRNIPVKSMVAGEVLYVGRWNGPSGETVIIGGDDGRMYSYAHLATGSYRVREGQRVARGQDIAVMDEPTGRTNGGRCTHVVIRELPFAARAGEEPDFKRWSYVNRNPRNTDRVLPARFDEALDAFRAAQGGTLTFRDLPRNEGDILFNANPQVGEVMRPAIAEDYQPRVRPRAPASAPAAREDSWYESILRSIACNLMPTEQSEQICAPPRTPNPPPRQR